MSSSSLTAPSTSILLSKTRNETRRVPDGEQRVELGLGLGEAFVVGRVDQEDDTVDLREVFALKATGYVELST